MMLLLTGHKCDDDILQPAGRSTVWQWSSNHSCNWLLEVMHVSCSQHMTGASFLSHRDHMTDTTAVRAYQRCYDNFQPAQCLVSVSSFMHC